LKGNAALKDKFLLSTFLTGFLCSFLGRDIRYEKGENENGQQLRQAHLTRIKVLVHNQK
jgi:hypothetical protein